MSYRFDIGDRTLARGTRRIALDLASRALGHIDRPSLPQPETVHEIRKNVKKLRALLRLVHPGLGDHAALDTLLRDAARHVAALRDADVLLHTLDALAPDGLNAIRSALSAAPARDPRSAQEALAACRAELAEARRSLKALEITGTDEEVLEAGLNAILRRARKKMRVVLRDPGPTAIHDLRKRIKDHLYHARLLAPLWPAAMDPHVAIVDALAENLGLMNDIAVFNERLATLDVPADERAEALRLAGIRHDRLMLSVLPVAARLLAGDPDDIGERWSAWWSIWQAERQG